jgi:hypothetical protein
MAKYIYVPPMGTVRGIYRNQTLISNLSYIKAFYIWMIFYKSLIYN